MRSRMVIVSLMSLVLLVAFGSGNRAHGVGGSIEVLIDDCSPLSGTDVVTLAVPGTPLVCPPPPATPKVTITASGAGNARIEWSGDDTNADILHLKDAKIQANQQISNFHFIFKRVFDPGPPDHWYNTHLSAVISPQAGNKVTVTSKVEHPVGTEVLALAKTISHTYPPQIPAGGIYATPRPKASGLTGQRRLLVDMKLDLKANATLDFGNKWLMFNSQPFPDDPPRPEEPANKLEGILREFRDLIGPEGCLGIHIESSGCVGVHVK